MTPWNSSTLEATKLQGGIPNIQTSVSPFLYSVHLSSFKKKSLADRAIEKICQEGLEAFGMVVQMPETGTWYRILVGQYETREEAQSLANRLRESGAFPYSMVTSISQEGIKIKPEMKGSRL